MKTHAYLIAVTSLVSILTLSAAEPAQVPAAATPANPASPGGTTASPDPLKATDSCLSLPAQVRAGINEDPVKVIAVAADLVARNPACSCEIVKAAIEISKADAKTVAAIVEAAINASPEHMRLIAQCAIAIAPDALAEVQAVLARLTPNSGEAGESSKSAKSAKSVGPQGEVANMPNPLDFPGAGPVGPTPGGPGGFPLIDALVPIITPPNVTEVNP